MENFHPLQGPPKPHPIGRSIQLHLYRGYFKEYLQGLKELEQLVKHVRAEANTNPAELKKILDEIEIRKDYLDKFKTAHFTPNALHILKLKISQRKKKRRSMKRRQKLPLTVQRDIATKHREFLTQESLKKKQADEAKNEADNILKSVRHQIEEGKYQIKLITMLKKLHSVKLQCSTHEKTSHAPTIEETLRLNNILDNLELLWQKKIEMYTTEENNLQTVINELTRNVEDEQIENLKNIFDQWLIFLFGVPKMDEQLYYSDFDNFVNIRNDWDRYVVNEPELGSRIPSGWVIPEYKEDQDWYKFTKK